MAARRNRAAAAAAATSPTPPPAAAKQAATERAPRPRRQRVTATELTEQALAEAADDEATRQLLSAPEPSEVPELDGEDGEDGEDGDDGETIDLTADDVDAPPDLEPARPSQYLPAPVRVEAVPAMIRHHRGRVFGPDKHRHMSEMGPVATSNWIGMVDGNRVSVRFGAPLSTIPKNVRAELAKCKRVRFAIAPPPEARGTVRVERDLDAPRARRGNPGKNEERVRSRFAPIRQLPVE